jgi:branched-chain amino acid transport system ATP-binding protein
MALLQIENLTKSFGGLKAVSAFDQEIDKGEIIGLIGPNGAGKSTLFSLINGFHRADAGRILFNGEDITHKGPHEICMKGIARSFQVVRPFSDMTVLDNVVVGTFGRSDARQEARKRAIRVLEFVGLDTKRNRLAKSLTIADKKRLEMARALGTEPKLLLLDEVMAGLNPKETEETISLVREIRKTGVTLFIIEHIMRVIMTLSDRISILHHGQKIAEGAPEEVVKNEKVIKAYLGEGYVYSRAE